MDNTSQMAGALVLAFIVFITARGELPRYLAFVGIGPLANQLAPDKTAATPTSSGGGGGSTDDKVKLALEAAKIAAMFA